VLTVAAVTHANGGDIIGVYVRVFATTGVGGMLTYVPVFLVLVAVWCAAGLLVAGRPLVASALTRWATSCSASSSFSIGLIILVEGHAFGL